MSKDSKDKVICGWQRSSLSKNSSYFIFLTRIYLKCSIKYRDKNTRDVCKVRGLTLLLRVGTLWRFGDGLFFEVGLLVISYALLVRKNIQINEYWFDICLSSGDILQPLKWAKSSWHFSKWVTLLGQADD
jgi:hypothetical protein